MITQPNYSLAELSKLKTHFIGIGGAGMSGIARIMLAKGFSISGSDKNDSPMLTSLKAAGALIGAVMKETKGQANAAKVRELLLKHLGQA